MDPDNDDRDLDNATPAEDFYSNYPRSTQWSCSQCHQDFWGHERIIIDGVDVCPDCLEDPDAKFKEEGAEPWKCSACTENHTTFGRFIIGDELNCEECISMIMNMALGDESSFPPKWHIKTLHPQSFRRIFDDAFVKRYIKKTWEYRCIPRLRVYCPHPSGFDPSTKCNAFVGKRTELRKLERDIDEQERQMNLLEPFQDCEACGRPVCLKCGTINLDDRNNHVCFLRGARSRFHEEIYDGRIRGRDYQFCSGCGVKMTLEDGCNHIQCSRCQENYCYLCGKTVTAASGDLNLPNKHWSWSWDNVPGCPRWLQPDNVDARWDKGPWQFVLDFLDDTYEVISGEIANTQKFESGAPNPGVARDVLKFVRELIHVMQEIIRFLQKERRGQWYPELASYADLRRLTALRRFEMGYPDRLNVSYPRVIEVMQRLVDTLRDVIVPQGQELVLEDFDYVRNFDAVFLDAFDHGDFADSQQYPESLHDLVEEINSRFMDESNRSTPIWLSELWDLTRTLLEVGHYMAQNRRTIPGGSGFDGEVRLVRRLWPRLKLRMRASNPRLADIVETTLLTMEDSFERTEEENILELRRVHQLHGSEDINDLMYISLLNDRLEQLQKARQRFNHWNDLTYNELVLQTLLVDLTNVLAFPSAVRQNPSEEYITLTRGIGMKRAVLYRERHMRDALPRVLEIADFYETNINLGNV